MALIDVKEAGNMYYFMEQYLSEKGIKVVAVGLKGGRWEYRIITSVLIAEKVC